MYLHLPDIVFFEKEIDRKVLQQNACYWDGYYQLISNDRSLEIGITNNKLNDTNYIVLYPKKRENKTYNVTVNILYGDEWNKIVTYNHDIKLLFEEKLTWVGTYYPEPKHFQYGSNECKVNIINYSSDIQWDISALRWRGFQCIGLKLTDSNAVVEIPIDKFAPQQNWKYAVIRGHRLDKGTTLMHKTSENITRPITFTYANREIEIVLRPNESIYYYGNDGSSGFGLTYIQFFK